MKLPRMVDAPSPRDLPNYDYGTATAALAHLFEQAQADRLDYYRPISADYWNVWLNDMLDPQTGYRGVRMTLDEFARRFATGTLPSQQPEQKGGAA